MNQRKDINTLILLILFGKLGLYLFFSAYFATSIQTPEINQFLENFGSTQGIGLEQIPQSLSPLMLYLLVALRSIGTFLHVNSIIVSNLLESLPIIAADLIILYIFLDFFPNRKKKIILYYFLNPIIIYTTCILNLYELVPVALIFLSINLLLKNRYKKSFFSLSLAVCFNINSILVLPLIFIFLGMHLKRKQFLECAAIFLIVYSLFTLPFILKHGVIETLLFISTNSVLFDSGFKIGDIPFHFTWFGLCVVYALFFRYKKINRDLLFSFCGLVFTVSVLSTTQKPENYVWFLPFICSFFIKHKSPDNNKVWFHTALCVSYLIYFILFYPTENDRIQFLSVSEGSSPLLANNDFEGIFFTVLQSLVFINIFIFYKYALKSNQYYHDLQIMSFGIGGDSGSGKSKLLTDLKGMFKKRLLDLEGDGEHKWERGDSNWEKLTHLNPKANYIYEQANNIRNLKTGQSIYRREYDHGSGKFTEKFRVVPKKYIVLCGLHPFYLPKLRKILDLKIYMDTDEDLRKHWKIIRDTQKRGYTKEKILKQIEDRVLDSQKYIKPQKQYADFIIHYYSDDDYTPGDTGTTPHIKLKVIFDADLQIERLVETLEENGNTVEWDYLENLEKQFLILHNKPPENSIAYFQEYLLNNVVNIEELIDVSMDVQWGYRGVIQMLILQIVSLKLKAKRI